MAADDVIAEVHFGMRPLQKAVHYACGQRYSGLNQVRELQYLWCWSGVKSDIFISLLLRKLPI